MPVLLRPGPQSGYMRVVFGTAGQIGLGVFAFFGTAQLFANEHSHLVLRLAVLAYQSAVLAVVLAVIVTPLLLRWGVNVRSLLLTARSAITAPAIGAAIAFAFIADHIGQHLR
jgi:hypothetical protein